MVVYICKLYFNHLIFHIKVEMCSDPNINVSSFAIIYSQIRIIIILGMRLGLKLVSHACSENRGKSGGEFHM